MNYILSISKNRQTDTKLKQSNCLINDDMEKNENERTERINCFEEFDKTKLENYEKRYLVRGKYFIYPDSIPFIYPSKEGSYDIPKGLKDYLEKYKKKIEEGRRWHYGQ